MATDKQINTSFNNSRVGKLINDKQDAINQSRNRNQQISNGTNKPDNTSSDPDTRK